MTNFYSSLRIPFMLCWLTGCVLESGTLPTLALPETLNTPPQALRQAPYLAKQVTIPKGETWLLNTVQASYKDMPATLALQKMAAGHPVKALFEIITIPTVSSPPDAITIQDHLQAICNQANWSYSVSNGVVMINDTETKTFRLAIQPGSIEGTMLLNSLGSANNRSNASSNNVTLRLDPYQDEVEALINSVLAQQEVEATDSAATAAPVTETLTNPNVKILPSANSVIVTAKPNQMRRLETVMEEYQDNTGKSVTVNLTLYEVSLNNTNERSLELNILRAGAAAFGINLTPPTTTSNPSSLSFNFNDASSRYNGSKTVGRWLSTLGQTQIRFEDQVEVRNNTIASMNATVARKYVANITRATPTTALVAEGAPEVEIDTLTTGWSISVQPTIVDDDITLNLAISRANLLDIIPYSFDNGRIAGTNFITSNLNRRMSIQLVNGVTKMLSSLKDSQQRTTTARTPWLPYVGDRVDGRDQQREIVMIVTATIN